MKEKCCIACGHRLLEDALMELTNMPSSAQNIPDREEVKTDGGISLHLHQCGFCGLVQFDCEPVDYYKDVIRSGGFSTTMVELRRNQYKELIETYHLEGRRFIEVGCGQGEFLSVLREFPVEAYGIEHKAELASLAKERGLLVWEQFTDTPDTMLESPDGEFHAPYDVFLSFNFLEHQPDPVGMLRCIYNNLSDDGMGLLTVPSLEYILEHDGYYELIRDHLAYYTMDTLGDVLSRAGFTVIEERMINRDTLSVVVKKERKKVRRVDVSGLRESRSIIDAEVNGLIDDLRRDGKTLAIWGASHQGFTLAATTGLGDKVSYIIDSAPFKQGRFAPASHIPIVPKEYFHAHPVDEILIVAPGYTEEIAGIIRRDFGADVGIRSLRSNHIETL